MTRATGARRHAAPDVALARALAVAVAVAVASPAPARASSAPRPLGRTAAPRARDDSAAIEQAAELLDAALRDGSASPQRARHARLARDLLAPALAARPDDAELRHLLGRAGALECEGEHAPPALVERAISDLRRARALAPDAHALTVAAELGDLLGKVGRFEEAVDEYDRAITWQRELVIAGGQDDDRAELARLEGNSAESAMALGRLDDAIARYRRAAAAQPPGLRLPSLPWLGLAVALDRDGQRDKARAAMRKAHALDPRHEALDSPAVYFVPAGERWYYAALSTAAEGRLAESEGAMRRFLVELPGSRYATRARAHLTELARARAGVPPVLDVEVAGADVDRSALEDAADASRERLRACLAATRAGEVEAPLRLAVRPDGGVRIADSDLPRGAASALPCLRRVVAGWRLRPAPGGAAVLLLRLHAP